MVLAHNGNLTNAKELKEQQFKVARRHINTTSDSEVLLNVLAHELDLCDKMALRPEDIFSAVRKVHQQIRGAYAVVSGDRPRPHRFPRSQRHSPADPGSPGRRAGAGGVHARLRERGPRRHRLRDGA
jgi:glucosamine 6-phosphate synthetase-like amidotransferase/phosphosugar isomerase protein